MYTIIYGISLASQMVYAMRDYQYLALNRFELIVGVGSIKRD